VVFRIFAKLYEIFLRTFRPISIQYFCQIFPSRHYPTSVPNCQECHLDIFIPFRDKWNLTERCLTSLLDQKTSSIHITLHLIDNGSSHETQASLNEWRKQNKEDLHVISHRVDEPFNFSRLCNIALKSLPADSNQRHFLFLNNDVILNDPETLLKSAQFIQANPDCGALGITLLYADNTIQHLFAAPGVKIIAAHPFKGRPIRILTEWNKLARRVPAITGAYLMVSSKKFLEVGGFDENLPTAGQDIDLCLKLQEKGWGTWVLPILQATHLESASRKKSRINRVEVDYMYRKWQRSLTQHPEYPVNISRWSEQPVKRMKEGRYPYEFTI
jgi:GT2 family glycosyltransferase